MTEVEYKDRQYQTFARLGTKPEEWRYNDECRETRDSSGSPNGICDLCAEEGLAYKYTIVHPKGLRMGIGSSCIANYMFASPAQEGAFKSTVRKARKRAFLVSALIRNFGLPFEEAKAIVDRYQIKVEGTVKTGQRVLFYGVVREQQRFGTRAIEGWHTLTQEQAEKFAKLAVKEVAFWKRMDAIKAEYEGEIGPSKKQAGDSIVAWNDYVSTIKSGPGDYTPSSFPNESLAKAAIEAGKEFSAVHGIAWAKKSAAEKVLREEFWGQKELEQ